MRINSKIFSTVLLFIVSVESYADNITTSLLLKERTTLDQLANNVQNPDHARFRQYYTPDEIRDLVAPPDEEYAKLVRDLREEGFSITYQSPSHTVVSIRADHFLFEKVFKILNCKNG